MADGTGFREADRFVQVRPYKDDTVVVTAVGTTIFTRRDGRDETGRVYARCRDCLGAIAFFPTQNGKLAPVAASSAPADWRTNPPTFDPAVHVFHRCPR